MKGLVVILWLFITTSASAQQIFVNEKFGFRIQEPSGWIKLTDKRLDYNLSGTHGYHIVSFSKYNPKKHKGFNPIISVNAGENWRSFEELSSYTMQNRNHKNQGLDRFSSLQEPEIISFQNLKAIYRADQYTIKGRHGGKFIARRKSYVVPSGKYVFNIDFVDAPSSEDEAKLFEKLVESIKFGIN